MKIINKVSREKVLRVAFSTFRVNFLSQNLVDDCFDTVELMVEAGILKVIDAS